MILLLCGVVTFVPNPLLLLFYTEHMRTHSKEKPFACDVDGCDFTAATSTGLTCEHSLRYVFLLSSCDASPVTTTCLYVRVQIIRAASI